MGSARKWPIEPPPTRWEFPDPRIGGDQDYLGEGADLEPGTLLAAYRQSIFPMPLRSGGPPAWWSPARRGILPLDELRVTRSLRKSCKRFEIRVDTAFDRVIEACADPDRHGSWISRKIIAAYTRLHELGWAHSVEAWNAEGGLVGGLYGVAIAGLFAGESMFHVERDASKAALVGLVAILKGDGLEGEGLTRTGPGAHRLLDVQWATEHLISLGAVEVSRTEYLTLLDQALRLATMPPVFARTESIEAE